MHQKKTSRFEIIKNTAWHADWSGLFPFTEVSTAPRIYFSGLQQKFGQAFTHFLIIYHKGVASMRLPEDEYRKLGIYLGKKLEDLQYANHWAQEFKQIADGINQAINVSPREFLEKLASLEKLYQNYGAYNVATKTVFDVMAQALDPRVNNLLENARKYSETFYKTNAYKFTEVAQLIKKQSGYPERYILMMDQRELLKYAKTKVLPKQDILSSRYNCCGAYFYQDKILFLSALEVKVVEKYWVNNLQKESLKGTRAYRGKVQGKCRIVFNYQDTKLKKGEILVTGMTDPNFIPLIKKAAAIITDGGGMLSHAAIVARELKIPCIIGTKIATQVLKDGDMVEVDGTTGIVKIIEE